MERGRGEGDRVRRAARPGRTPAGLHRRARLRGCGRRRLRHRLDDPLPFPTDRCYPQAAAGLGPDHTTDWLVGAREIDELAVRPAAHGTGLAADLLEVVTADAPDGRSWLLTSVRSGRAMSFYRRQGWTQATHPSPDGRGIVVFLGPRHPARSLAPRPL